MNAPLRRVALAVMLLFGLLLLNANYLQVVRAKELHNDPNNPRLILEEYSRERGPILVGDKAEAYSVKTDDRLKYLRKYAQGPLYAPATGFYSIVYGASGIEVDENSILAGTDDSLFVRRVIDQLTGEQVKGGSVQLTLNAKAQRAAYAGLHGRKGAVVALDPSTGAILALVSSPSYNPSLLSSHDTAKVRAAHERLTKDPDQPMLNRALRETYPPGSTFKLVTAAAALESGKFRRDSLVFNGASLDLPQTTVNLPTFDGQSCSASGQATLEDALKRSCNPAFGKVGLELGANRLRKQAERFGFNRAFDVPMKSARSRFPLNTDPPQTAQSAIGQFDVRATPLQMAMVAATIGNRGVLMNPFLVREVRAPDLSVLNTTRPHEVGQVVSPQTADTLAQMMVTVVEQGTGSNAKISGVRVGGKTGTAQQGANRKPHAWFVSLAPINDPKVAVAVVLEDGGGAAEVSGNQLAAPIARAVMLAVLGR
ncbi:MAG: penicillin-binding protein 2 [Sporichthyaceae bacterium]